MSLSPLVNKKASISRAKLVISLLYKENLIDLMQKKNAINELNNFILKNKYTLVKSRYFIDWIYGQTPDEILRSRKDLLIRSTLSSRIQGIVNKAVKEETKKEKRRYW